MYSLIQVRVDLTPNQSQSSCMTKAASDASVALSRSQKCVPLIAPVRFPKQEQRWPDWPDKREHHVLKTPSLH